MTFIRHPSGKFIVWEHILYQGNFISSVVYYIY